MMEENRETPFEQIVAELVDESQPFSPKRLRAFSDLDNGSLDKLKQSWPAVSVNRKIALLEDLEDLTEADTLVSCDAVGKFAMQDAEPSVRRQAIHLLWDCEDTSLIPVFMDLLENDPAETVRAAAASALGKFILLGELEEIPKEKADPVFAKLLEVVQRKPEGEIQRKALEALGYSGEDIVPKLINQAMQRNDEQWTASALFAMGRTLDDRWEKIVLEHINDPDQSIQIEAIRAAGELELSVANELLFEMLDDEDLDSELLYYIYWALSKIGGKGVKERLEQELEETVDEDLMDVLDMALENLDFTEDSEDLDLFDIE
ncbi:MAG: HEAT repeat domain-containing protein [Anaerolineaceae bacterium]